MRTNFLVYVAALAIFGGGIVLVLERGARLEGSRPVASSAPRAATSGDASLGSSRSRPAGIVGRLQQPLPRLLLQVMVIIIAARAIGALFQRLGQPAVIGEIVAGIALGPSLLGAASPRISAFLFAPSTTGMLRLLADLGVLLFLFVVGLELDVSSVRRQAHSAVVVSHASIIVPYFLGVVLAFVLYPDLAPAGVRFAPFALFLGIAMSITAFPVLARILEERGLTRTPLGAAAITCAAVDDATAWSLLAFVAAASGTSGIGGALVTIGLTVAFVLAMLAAIGPWLRRAFAVRAAAGEPGKTAVAAALLFLFASALATELIGIHALFGAFLAGVVMPRDPGFRAYLAQRLERFSSVFLLPLFFAFTGLRTEIGLLDDARAWALCAAVILVATAGKLGGTWIAARVTGMSGTDAFALGALMNTRGLVELIVLNLGYELGILSPRIFTMLVLMALATTFATGPLLSLADRMGSRSAARPRSRADTGRPTFPPAAEGQRRSPKSGI